MTKYHPLRELVLARLKEFYREPAAIFWVYGFPLMLALGLGLAFAGSSPEPPPVDVQGSDEDVQVKYLQQVLRAGGIKKVEAHPEDACRKRLRTGKTALFI